MQVQFKQWLCDVTKSKYANDRTVLKLVDSKTFDLVAVATVNIPSEKLAQNEVIIKDYSENRGMYQCLQQNGIISEPKRYVKSGFVTCPICDLLM